MTEPILYGQFPDHSQRPLFSDSSNCKLLEIGTSKFNSSVWLLCSVSRVVNTTPSLFLNSNVINFKKHKILDSNAKNLNKLSKKIRCCSPLK